MKAFMKPTTWVITVLYVVFLFWYLRGNDIGFTNVVSQMFGNIILFLPIGILLPLLTKFFLSATKVIITTLIISLLFECIQIVFGLGNFNVDDVIYNTVGGTIGYLIWRHVIYVFLVKVVFTKKNP
ncbi:MAG: VanZ family protein [Kurthia sp.]|nr:VanZ family protein [Candidatus Kurthia equi]